MKLIITVILITLMVVMPASCGANDVSYDWSTLTTLSLPSASLLVLPTNVLLLLLVVASVFSLLY